MGSACCVAAKDRTITNGSTSDVMPRNVRYSPSWSVRWDNRRRVAGEEMSMNWFSDGLATNDRSDNKSQTTVGTDYASEESSPLESFPNHTLQKPSPSEGNTVLPAAQSVSKNASEVKGSMDTPLASEHSVSSFSASPLSSSQPHFPRSHLLRQVSGMKSPNFSISGEGSPFMHPGRSRCSNQGSHGGSSDGWSVPAFSDLMATRWSFDSESLNFRSTSRVSSSPSVDIQTCGVCSKLLTEKSSWGSQKIIANNELAVAAILICGHVYHAECLENMTLEINKYDPACPVCTFGEKQAFKLSEKALRADLELKAKTSKKSRSRVVDGDMSGDAIIFDRHKSGGHEGRVPKMSSSLSLKSSNGKPFLKRHFSFGSKGRRSLLEDNSSWKKGFFWVKSSKE